MRGRFFWMFLGFQSVLLTATGCVTHRATFGEPELDTSKMAYDERATGDDRPEEVFVPQGPLPARCGFRSVEVDAAGLVRVDGEASGTAETNGPPSVAQGLWERVGPCFLHVFQQVGTEAHEVIVPEGAHLGQFMGVFATLVHAGYQNLKVQSGDDNLLMRLSVLPEKVGAGASVPVPAGRAEAPARAVPQESPFNVRRPKRLLLVRIEGSSFEFVWADQVVEGITRKRVLLPQKTPPEELRARLAKECSADEVTCNRVVIEAAPSTPLRTLAALLKALPARSKLPLVEFAFLDQAITGRMKAAELLGLEVESGTVEQSGVLRQIQSQTPKVTACYQKALSRDSGLRGRIVVRFLIESDGSVSDVMDARVGALPPSATLGHADVSFDSEGARYLAASSPGPDIITHEELTACVRRTFEPLRMPIPKDGPVLVLYPLSLAPG